MGLAVTVSPMFAYGFSQTLQSKKYRYQINYNTVALWKKAIMKSGN